MKLIYYFFFLFVGVQVQSQSLSIDETIDYLNKFSKDQPYFYHIPNGNECDYSGYYQFAINQEGILIVTAISSKSNCKANEESYTDIKTVLGKFYIQDIDTNKIFKTYPNGISLNCLLNDECIVQTFFRNNKEVTGKTSSIEVITSDSYNGNKLYNALIYLVSLALEKGYIRNDAGDPFANHQKKSITNSESKNDSRIKSNNTESKIFLKKEDGVYNLNLVINGVVIKFILDSGAGECSISSETEKRLIGNGIITQKDYLSNGLYKLADGTIVENKRVRIPKIVIDHKIVYNVITSIGQVGSPNLLGQSFLKKFNQWSIDNSRQLLIVK